MPKDPIIPQISRGVDTSQRNRAYDIRRDDDKFITPSITIYDIDYAVLWHLKNKMEFEVEENGNIIPVPVIIASGEKWAQIQKHGYMRGVDRKIMAPMIVLKRNSLTMNDSVPKLDVPIDNQSTQLILYSQTQNNNVSDWVNEKYNTKESKEIYFSVIPDHVKVSYTLYIWTDNQMQMNAIVEEIIPQSGLPWGDAMSFITIASDYSFDVINASGEDRMVKCEISLETQGILQKEFELKEASVKKQFSVKRVVFKNELEQDEVYSYFPPKIIRSGKSRLP